ncbi:DNA-3-methyladenine glycosylase I [Bifidobacterium indicum]|uniref:DNA-3-methyladenine glycosylase I n=1 Tax=Bifidobacterium indicum TaxID=1691 RepID=UPI002602DFC6|nr:DNA-3-methyladenine glycosylase I [uncultured Bifidobacterium sp.]
MGGNPGSVLNEPESSRMACDWAQGNDPQIRAYHDQEWGLPTHGSRALFEMLSLEIFQCGLSWQLILHRRQALRRAFADFDILTVAGYDLTDVERLVQDSTIIRNRRKIEATIANAGVIADAFPGEGFDRYCWSFTGGKTINHDYPSDLSTPRYDHLSEIVSQDMKGSGFKFVGPVTVHSFLQATGIVNDHQRGCCLNACRA